MKKVTALLITLFLSIFFICGDKKANTSSNSSSEKELTVINNIYVVKENNSKTKSPIDITYLKNYNKDAKEDLIDKTEDHITNLYGKAFYEIAYLKDTYDMEPAYKALIYLPNSTESNGDNSALTIILKDNLVISYKIDDFNGLHYSYIPNIFNN